MKKLILSLFVLFLAASAQAQVGFSYHQSTRNSSFGISSNPDKGLWGEARISTATDEFDVTGMLLVNVVKREDFNLYSGAGFTSLLFEGGFSFALGFNVKPIEKKPNIAFFGEWNPLVPTEFDNYISTGSIGVRYFLRKKEE